MKQVGPTHEESMGYGIKPELYSTIMGKLFKQGVMWRELNFYETILVALRKNCTERDEG